LSKIRRVGKEVAIMLGHLGTRNAGVAVWLGVNHASTVEKILNVFGLPKVNASRVPGGLNAKEVGKGAKVLHGKVKLEFANNRLHGGVIVTCDNNVIDIH
jgi:hypothetical protein